MPTSVLPPPLRRLVPVLSRHARLTAVVLPVVLVALTFAWPLPETARPDAAVVSLTLTDASGKVLREVRPDGRGAPVGLDAIDPAVVDALLATEDRRFWHHPGVDVPALARATWDNLTAGRVVSGASTLTMQVARLLRREPDRGLVDKLMEMHLAVRLELHWSKTKILETWLNRVSFGNRARGIEAASRLYFSKSARDLTRAEAAFLVGLPQSPSRYNPFRHLNRARERQTRVLQAMHGAGHVSAQTRDRLAALPLDLNPPASAFRAPHFTEALLAAAPGTTSSDASSPNPDAFPFGLPRHPVAAPPVEIRTTLDPALQSTVEGLLRGHVKLLASESVTNAAALVLDNRTGAVLAYAGSADFWNGASGGQNDGVQMLRQPGSTLKPFTYARALSSGRVTAASVLPDVELQVPEAGGAFSPTNYDDRYHGPVPLRTALAASYNVPAVRLAREMGADRLLQTLHDAGFASLTRAPSHYGAGLTLGNGEVRLWELARAYAGLARGGALPPVHAVRWIRTARGDTTRGLLRPPASTSASMGLPPGVVHVITDVLADPDARAPAFGRGSPLECSFPCAAKTGTSKDYRDNWTVGFTPTHTVAVWVGNFDGAPMRRVSGVTGAAPLFQSILAAIGSGGDFDAPTGLKTAAVCPSSGARPGTFCPTTRTETFLPGTVPPDTCAVHREIRIDARTGQRADASTPARHVRPTVFAVHPEIYHPWMRAHDVPLPPSLADPPVRTARTSAEATSDRLQVQVPVDGGRFMRDPVLRDAYQRLHLRGAAPTTWTDVHWRVDGTRLDADYREATWALQAGTHTFTLHAVTPEGVSLQSRPSVIAVHDVPSRPAWSDDEAAVPLR